MAASPALPVHETPTLQARCRRMFRSGLGQNIIALYGLQSVRYILPMLTVPYLARVLGPDGWGKVAFAQAFGNYMALAVDYGFGLSGTRDVARNRDDSAELSRIVAGVAGAKLVIAAICCVIGFVTIRAVPALADNPFFIWMALFGGVAQGLSLVWYFQGLERMRIVASIDIFSKLIGTAGVFLIVRGPGDGGLVLALNGAACAVSALCGFTLLYREVKFCIPSLRAVVDALRSGWSMFLFTGAVTMYTAGNAFVLGLFVAPVYVGYYAGAEKLARAVYGLLSPIGGALYPRLAFLVRKDPAGAARLARIGAIFMMAVGSILGAVLFLTARSAILLVLGAQFEPAILCLRIFAALPLAIAISNVMGMQWMLPLGMDRTFNGIIIGAGVLNVSAAFLFVPGYQAVGMAWCVTVCECLVSVSMLGVLFGKRADPWSYGRRAADLSRMRRMSAASDPPAGSCSDPGGSLDRRP